MDIDPRQCDDEYSPKKKCTASSAPNLFPDLLHVWSSWPHHFHIHSVDHQLRGCRTEEEEEGATAATAAATRWFSYTVEIRMLSSIDLGTHQFSHFLHPPLRSPLQHLWLSPHSDDSDSTLLHQYAPLWYCIHMSSPLNPVFITPNRRHSLSEATVSRRVCWKSMMMDCSSNCQTNAHN